MGGAGRKSCTWLLMCDEVEMGQITVHSHSSGEGTAGSVAEADDTDEGRRAWRAGGGVVC